jgi:hypothetical protein
MIFLDIPTIQLTLSPALAEFVSWFLMAAVYHVCMILMVKMFIF